MCGTGDINVQDFKAHAVIVGGSWHFREKVGGTLVPLMNLFQEVQNITSRPDSDHASSISSPVSRCHRMLSVGKKAKNKKV